MQMDDFFLPPDNLGIMFGVDPHPGLKTDLLKRVVAGPVEGDDDLETVTSLARLVHGEFMAFGTDRRERLTNEQIAQAHRALRVVLRRHGLELKLPWRDFSTFQAYWLENNAKGSWAARRAILAKFFTPVFEKLGRLEDARLDGLLAEPVTTHHATGWPHVDAELGELKRRFRSAITPQDYRDVGNRAVAVLEALSRAVYVPEKHLRDGETEPTYDKTKQRLGRYVEDSLAGSSNSEIRGVTVKVIELAQAVKHAPAPTRRDAGISADAVILLANILRRVDQDF